MKALLIIGFASVLALLGWVGLSYLHLDPLQAIAIPVVLLGIASYRVAGMAIRDEGPIDLGLEEAVIVGSGYWKALVIAIPGLLWCLDVNCPYPKQAAALAIVFGGLTVAINCLTILAAALQWLARMRERPDDTPVTLRSAVNELETRVATGNLCLTCQSGCPESCPCHCHHDLV